MPNAAPVYYRFMTGPRFAAIAHDLRERIALGEYSQLSHLESEAELGARYAVSRPTVRRALELLRDEGIVESRPGAGWFVTGAAYHQRLALGTFRHAPSAMRDAGGDVARTVVDFAFRPAPAAIASLLGLARHDSVLAAQSVRTVDGEFLDVAHEWVPAAFAGGISRDTAADPGIWATLGRSGRHVATVHQTITAGLASAADAELLHTSPGVPLLLVRRVASDADGIPLALSDHRYLAHRFALEVEFHSGPAAAAVDPPGLRAVPPLEEKLS